MHTLRASFNIPDPILRGLSNGSLERVGGVVRDARNKEIYAWLRETVPSNIRNIKADHLGIEPLVGLLNLSLSASGFALVLNRLDDLYEAVRQNQETLTAIDQKIDLSNYSSFVSAVKQAQAAFIAKNEQTRHMTALQAVDRLLVSQHYFSRMAEKAVSKHTGDAFDLLVTLSLAYVAEIRCHLEMDEADIAQSRLSEGLNLIRPLSTDFIKTEMSDSNLSLSTPELQSQVSLVRLASIYRWIGEDDSEDEIRKREERKSGLQIFNELFGAGMQVANVENSLLGFLDDFDVLGLRKRAFSDGLDAVAKRRKILQARVPERIRRIESLIEDAKRLEGYEQEIEMLSRSGISFREWCMIDVPFTQNNPSDSYLCYLF